MKFLILNAIFLVIFSFSLLQKGTSSRNGGISCIACTIAVGLVEQVAEVNNETISDSMARFCSALPQGKYQVACTAVIKIFGPVIIDLLYMRETPDLICKALSLCYTAPDTKQCHLYPAPLGGFNKAEEKTRRAKDKFFTKYRLKDFIGKEDNSTKLPKICKIPGIELLCYMFLRVEGEMLPALDIDNDYFSVEETLRGSGWRGKDCNDLSFSIHPGARPINSDREVDSNCNGIYGVDPDNGKPFEDLLCDGTGQRGLVVLGDSVSAHFHIPSVWVIPSQISPGIFEHLPYVLENEMDWPMMSYLTGFKNLTWPIISGPTRSVYTKLREHNLCNHRDFQNLAVNGADSFNLQKYQLSLARDNFTDFPVLIAIALVGNDVCNHFDDTVDHMTTPKQMYDNLVKTLTFLNERVPSGSHVLLTDVADGRYLYEFMHRRVHPLGHLNSDIKYPDLYNYLNCLDISPCSGWMNSNATVRNTTALRVQQLNKAILKVYTDYQHKFSQFDISHINNPVNDVINEWEKAHGPGSGYQLIEPMDGFHPNQEAQALIGDYIWNYVARNLTHLIGDVNPHNSKIVEIFGDQGDH